MFETIKPKGQYAHRQKVDALLGLLKIYHKFYLAPEIKENATFMIAEDDKRGVYGGAVVYPQKNTYPDCSRWEKDPLGEITAAFQSRRKEIWTARICLCIGAGSSTSSLELIDLCESFYKNLYQEFISFKKRKRIGLLAFTLRIAETYKTDVLQKWASLYEIKLKESSDGFFHGILDLPITNRASKEQSYKVLDFSSKARSDAA